MNLRRAAALALAGWYLMTPPLYPHQLVKGVNVFDSNAPLSKWIIYSGHDSAKECEDARAHDLDIYVVGHKWSRLADRLTLSQCVATDDPRLKEK